MALGPNEMDIEYLNSLGSTFLAHRPNAMDIEFLNKLTNNDFRVRDYEALQPSSSAYINLGPDAIELTSTTIYTGYSPDTSEWTG